MRKFDVIVQLICTFVFACAKSKFSHDTANILNTAKLVRLLDI